MTDRVFRGGCWFNDASFTRVARRYYSGPSYRYGYLGFRLVEEVEEVEEVIPVVRVLRGGCWYGVASFTRVARRILNDPSLRDVHLGFRLVEEPKEVPRVFRGGGWFNAPACARVAFRLGYTPSVRSYYLGFRLVEEAEEPKVEEPKEVEKMNRGGCWYDAPAFARVAFRGGDTPSYRNFDLGFRLVEE